MPSRTPTTSPQGSIAEVSFKYSPLEYARVLFASFFQGLFQAAPPGAYHWTDDEQSEIYITDENPVKGATIGQRPCITLTRGPVQFYSLGLDDMVDYSFQTGTKRKSVLVPGTMTVNCCSRVQLECERIAFICAENLWLHRELLMQAGFFEIGRQPVIGAPSPAGSIIVADAGDEWYVVPVQFPFQFYRTSQTSPLGRQIIQNIGLQLTAWMQRVREQNKDGCGPIDGGGAGLPYEVEVQRPPPFAPAASDVNGGTPNPGNPPAQLPLMPHPLNPAQMVTVRASRPYGPAVRPPSMGGRAIPIATSTVEESDGDPADAVTSTSSFKV